MPDLSMRQEHSVESIKPYGLPQDPCAQDNGVHQLTGSRGGIAHAQSFDKHPCNGALCTSSGSLSVVPAQIMTVSTKRVI